MNQKLLQKSNVLKSNIAFWQKKCFGPTVGRANAAATGPASSGLIVKSIGESKLTSQKEDNDWCSADVCYAVFISETLAVFRLHTDLKGREKREGLSIAIVHRPCRFLSSPIPIKSERRLPSLCI